MPPRLWQRQPGEAPPDFTAFVTYLRLKGRRSHRTVATQTGRSLGAIRRLSAQFNWLARVTAFEARLADASQNALDLLVRATTTRTAADCQRLREAEFQLAQRVLQESGRWFQLASDPRRRDVSLAQVCRVLELASKLGRLAAGMPTGHEPRCPVREDAPDGWTGPSMEEALQKIYGSPTVAQPGEGRGIVRDTTEVSPPPDDRAPVGVQSQPLPANSEPLTCNPPPSTPPVAPPGFRRRDAWSAWTRIQRQAASIKSR